MLWISSVRVRTGSKLSNKAWFCFENPGYRPWVAHQSGCHCIRWHLSPEFGQRRCAGIFLRKRWCGIKRLLLSSLCGKDNVKGRSGDQEKMFWNSWRLRRLWYFVYARLSVGYANTNLLTTRRKGADFKHVKKKIFERGETWVKNTLEVFIHIVN